MTKIFISYRHDESLDAIKRICKELNKRIERNDDEEILIDATAIPPGENFHENLTDTIRSSNVLLVGVGKNWLNATDDHGTDLLQDPADKVRTEIESALIYGVPIIPVLVEGSMLPLATQVPASLLDFTNTMASPVRADPEFDGDIERLTTRINTHLNFSIDTIKEGHGGLNDFAIYRFFKSLFTGRSLAAICLTSAIALAGFFALNAYSSHLENDTIVSNEPEILPFTAMTKSTHDIVSEISGTVGVNNDYLKLTTRSGVIVSKLDTREYVQKVRFGLAKKSYAFDRFKVVSWAKPHMIERWVDNNSSIKLSPLDSTIPVPPPEPHSSTTKQESQPLKDYWLVFQVKFGEKTDANSSTSYAHSDKQIFKVN